MIKEYTLRAYEGSTLRFAWCGINLSVSFKNSGTRAHTSRFITSNQFVQDAIENDKRFGNAITLTAKYADTTDNASKIQVRKVKKVTNVRNTNDALRYLLKAGVEISDETDILAEAEKLNVEFVNLKME